MSASAQSTYGKIIDDFFDLLDVVLQGIKTLAQRVVFQVQQAEPTVEFRNETRNADGPLIVSGCYTIHSQSRLKNVQNKCNLLFIGSIEGPLPLINQSVESNWNSSIQLVATSL